MEKTKKLPALILVLGILTLCFHEIAFSQPQLDRSAKAESSIKPGISISQAEKGSATFLQTFLKTPFAILSCVFTFLAVLLTGMFECFGFLFSGFDYKFPITNEVIGIGWKGIVKYWWWQPGVTWHLILSLLLCVGILGSRR